MFPDGTGVPFKVAERTQLAVRAGVVGCPQFTVMTGVGCGVTVTTTVPVPVAVPPVTVSLEVTLPAVEYAQLAVPAVVESTDPLLSQSHAQLATAGAPLFGVTVAVNVELLPAMTVDGDAASVTVYDGSGACVTVIVVAADAMTVELLTVTVTDLVPGVE
jgi:hypothetical protein